MWPILLKLTMVTALAAHGADLASTEHCIGRGVCREMNPALARFENPVTFGAVKMGVAGGGVWATEKLATNHPKLAVAVNVAVTVGFSSLALHNAHVTRP